VLAVVHAGGFATGRCGWRWCRYNQTVRAYSTSQPHISTNNNRLATRNGRTQCNLVSGRHPNSRARQISPKVNAMRPDSAACRSICAACGCSCHRPQGRIDGSCASPLQRPAQSCNNTVQPKSNSIRLTIIQRACPPAPVAINTGQRSTKYANPITVISNPAQAIHSPDARCCLDAPIHNATQAAAISSTTPGRPQSMPQIWWPENSSHSPTPASTHRPNQAASRHLIEFTPG